MKDILLISCCFALTVAAPSIEDQWKSFKVNHKKKYLDKNEEEYRLSVFTENMKEIEKHNANYAQGKVTYTLKMNQFGDLRPGEFSSLLNGYSKNLPTTKSILAQEFTYPTNANLPDSIDWREKGAVTPVKNQERCRGCWAFSTTGAMEGQLFRSTGKLVSLSEQQLIDCSTSHDNEGCNGGLMDRAFEYIQEAGGLMSEDSYPFLGKDGNCMFKSDSVINGSKVTSYVVLKHGDEEALKAAVATVGPVAVAVSASSHDFMFYEEGILTRAGCEGELNHGVLVVGYGTESNQDYWIIKNSWGTGWGKKGYVRIERNKGNACGLATFPSYPVLVYSKDEKSPSPPPDQTTTDKPSVSSAWNTVLSSGYLLFACLFCLYLSRKN